MAFDSISGGCRGSRGKKANNKPKAHSCIREDMEFGDGKHLLQRLAPSKHRLYDSITLLPSPLFTVTTRAVDPGMGFERENQNGGRDHVTSELI
ncbi:hypothetical protein NPIL_557161 [Nephila pilipes]|uniref:Uncharacterized protein n=1 Tax=Nephila pilipes TaxID=299642 RepID=A0A8X6TYA5_NEPPI|nr:hypothetical protein NPIL_557161 [Nephila pilipes]